MSNYIGKVDAEWVDPAVELPPDEELRRVRLATGDEIHAYFDHYCEKWHGLIVVAWLRIGGPSTAIQDREAEIWNDLVESCREIVGYDGDLATKMAARAILDQMRHIEPKKVSGHD